MTTRDEPKLSSQDNVTNFDITSQLTKLWEISDNGKAEWWPSYIRQYMDSPDKFWYQGEGNERVRLSAFRQSDILLVVKGHAEEWLRGRGWNGIWPGSDHDREYESPEQDGRYISLTEAILAEVGREVK